LHELSIAEAILDAVRTEAGKRPGAHVTKVGVRVGALSGVEPEALSFGFSALVQGTDLEPLELVIEPVPRRQRCPACDFTFEVAEDNLACPRCARGETLLAGGEELNLAYLEVEE
jgi:hydrogenase nickel incorporation protein HypA/HybF